MPRELGEKLRGEGYSVHVKGRRPGLDWGVIFWLREIIRKEGITVVHAHQYTPLFYSVPAAKLLGKRVKVVYTEHGRFYPDRKSWKRALANPILVFGVDHVVAISNATADAMATYDKFPKHRIKVIYNGVDLSKLKPSLDLESKRHELGLSKNSKIIGTACRLNEIKNIPMMFKAFKLVNDDIPDTVLLIAGDGPNKSELMQFACEIGINDKVKFIGLRYDLPEIYCLLDVFVLSSFTEGISVTLLEAMGSTVPAVVTNVGGNPEVVLNRETGMLININAHQEMATAIKSLLLDTNLSDMYSKSGFNRIKNFFSFEKMILSYRDIYLF